MSIEIEWTELHPDSPEWDHRHVLYAYLNPHSTEIIYLAHREQDALAYANALDSIEPLELFTAQLNSHFLETLIQQLTAIGQLTANPALILMDIVKSNGTTDSRKARQNECQTKIATGNHASCVAFGPGISMPSSEFSTVL